MVQKKPLKTHTVIWRPGALALAIALAISTQARASDLDVAGGKLQVDGSISAGTVIRASDRDASLIPGPNAAVVGATGAGLQGKNQDDGDLNYAKGDAVSTALDADLDLKYSVGSYGAVVQIQAWYDSAQKNNNVPWGNSANNYAANQPLDDSGFAKRGKFSGVLLNNVYIFGHNEIGESKLDWKLGQQTLTWGNNFTIPGGLGDLSPADRPARRRAGLTAEDGDIAVPGASVKLALTEATTLDGFVQTSFRPNTPFGCGTFYSELDFVAEGCNKVMLGNGTDRQSLASGLYVDRAPDQNPSGLQGGIGITQRIASIDSDVGFYAAQYDSRMAFYGAIKSLRAPATPFVPLNPGGKNPQYFVEYPGDIRVFGLTFNKDLQGGSLRAELTYRPNQPYQYNAQDLLNAFASATAPTPLRAAATAAAPGAAFDGYERLKAAQLNIAFNHVLPGVLGANTSSVAVETAYKVAPDLPSLSVARFGRSSLYGTAAINGVCPATENAVDCSTSGYVTRDALAYRLRFGLRYLQVFSGVDFTPSVTYDHDVSGWSQDGVISAGRQFAIVSLKADIHKAWSVAFAWEPIWGGAYNNIKDRDTVSASISYKF